MKLRKLITASIMLLCMYGISFGQADDKYRKTLKKMFEVSGTEKAYEAGIKQMVIMFKEQMKEIDAKTWDELESEFLKASLTDLVDLMAPVYHKHLTQSDLEQLITFYETPFGKKYAEKTPLIMEESMSIGQEWGMKIGKQFQERLEKQKK
jgi:hypothetical protein